MTDQYKPLKDFAPFKAGERFRDKYGDVLLTIGDDCETLSGIEIGGVYCSTGLPKYPTFNRTSLVTPLDRETSPDRDNEAEFTIDPEKYNLWYQASDGLIHVKPSQPSFLPLEAGKTYQTAERGDWECIYAEGGNVWLKRTGDNYAEAYVWDAETGLAKSLKADGEYDIVGLASGDT